MNLGSLPDISPKMANEAEWQQMQRFNPRYGENYGTPPYSGYKSDYQWLYGSKAAGGQTNKYNSAVTPNRYGNESDMPGTANNRWELARSINELVGKMGWSQAQYNDWASLMGIGNMSNMVSNPETGQLMSNQTLAKAYVDLANQQNANEWWRDPTNASKLATQARLSREQALAQDAASGNFPSWLKSNLQQMQKYGATPEDLQAAVKSAFTPQTENGETRPMYAADPDFKHNMAMNIIQMKQNYEASQSNMIARELPDLFSQYKAQLGNQSGRSVTDKGLDETQFYKWVESNPTAKRMVEMKREYDSMQYPELYRAYQQFTETASDLGEKFMTYDEWVEKTPEARSYIAAQVYEKARPEYTRMPRWAVARS
jgi:hypothetical protein